MGYAGLGRLCMFGWFCERVNGVESERKTWSHGCGGEFMGNRLLSCSFETRDEERDRSTDERRRERERESKPERVDERERQKRE